MKLSPLLKLDSEWKAECIDEVCLWLDDKDNPRDSVGGSSELKLVAVISDAVEPI